MSDQQDDVLPPGALARPAWLAPGPIHEVTRYRSGCIEHLLFAREEDAKLWLRMHPHVAGAHYLHRHWGAVFLDDLMLTEFTMRQPDPAHGNPPITFYTGVSRLWAAPEVGALGRLG